jgi:hypothetical protein
MAISSMSIKVKKKLSDDSCNDSNVDRMKKWLSMSRDTTPLYLLEDKSPVADNEHSSKPQNCWQKVWPQVFFLVFGIGNAVTTKMAVICEAQGLSKWGYHKFQKPWFLTTICFFAMWCAMPIYMVMSYRAHKRGDDTMVMIHRLSCKAFCEFAIPAFSDAFEGIVSAVCIVFVGVSIDSMMKSGTLVGVSLISRWLFHQHYHTWQWWSIAGVVVALTVVGASGIISAGSSETIRTDRLWVSVIIILKFVSQVGYAVKISYEEYFVQKKFYHPIMICGVEGFWSFVMCGLICQPIAQFMPGEEGNGIREDTADTFEMVKNSPRLFGIIAAAWFLGLTYNCVSTTLIGRTSAVIRTLMEAFRTFLIWMVQFALYYGLGSSSDPEVYKFRMAGEEWATGAWVQLGGFILMTFSLFTYNGIPHYPCFNYGPIHVKGEAGTQELTGMSEKMPVVFEDHHVIIGSTPLLQGEKPIRIVSDVDTNTETSGRNQGEDEEDNDDSERSQSVGGDGRD